MVLPSISVLLDIGNKGTAPNNSFRSQQLDFIVHEANARYRLHKIDEFAQAALNIASIIGNHRDSNDCTAVFVQSTTSAIDTLCP